MKDPHEIFSQSALPEEAESDWKNFMLAYGPNTPKIAPNAFYRLFGNSRFLTRFLINNPDVFDKTVLTFNPKKEKSLQLFQQETHNIETSSPSPIQELKRYKYRELMRITMKDLEGDRDREVLRELSHLAYSILRSVTKIKYEELKNQLEVTPLTFNGSECLFHYLALGKMGGYELNYSSDIDLLAITETDEGSAGTLSLHEFFVKLTQNITHTLQHKDEIGFFYRVDWDLRPEGKSGTLINTLSALEYYYETFGAEWERQVFTKASPGAGNLQFGEKFIRIMAPFCYRKTFDLESIRRIQGMKEKIHDSIQTQLTKGFNVKLGVGGIRDIEFFVQAFLMVFGGVQPQIRHVSTLEIITLLCKEKMISNQTASDLNHSYLFLRRLENKLQMFEENQTQLIPNDEVLQLRIAKRLGYLGTDNQIFETFSGDLKRVTSTVKNIFDGLFLEKKSIESAPPFSLVATEKFAEQIRPHLLNKFNQADDFEQKLDALRFFKKTEFEKIAQNDQGDPGKRFEILKQLSIIAEITVQEALALAATELEPRFGHPQHEISNNQKDNTHFVALGMGKFGGHEINYYSDLDMIFIYSHNGETSGPRIISNAEYYAKLVQKFISILSVPTQYGVAFEIDTELRPSGNKGTLVTTLESFLEYQNTVSQVWERQALLRARPVAGSSYLANIISEHIDALLYSRNMPKGIKKEMHQLRSRVRKEIARENKQYIDIKLGRGALMDIEFILQFFQLSQASTLPSLRQKNTLLGLNKLAHLNILKDNLDVIILKEVYQFYRSMESLISLKAKRRIHRLRYDSPLLYETATQMGYTDFEQFKNKLMHYRDQVREIYRKVFSLKKNS